MVLFKKKEEVKVPELPPIPDLPREGAERGLPSLPPSFNEDFNRNIIKSAVNEEAESHEEEGSIPSVPLNEQEPEEIKKHEKFLPSEGTSEPVERIPTIRDKVRTIEGPESIFVRIDKFRAAKKELGFVKKNLSEAEAILNKIKEMKVKEDSEMSDINLNLDNIKKKIEEVDSLVFDKV